jgi:hypothetical protein
MESAEKEFSSIKKVKSFFSTKLKQLNENELYNHNQQNNSSRSNRTSLATSSNLISLSSLNVISHDEVFLKTINPK